MLRMEIALFLVVAFVAYMYFSAEKERTALHRTFSVLLVTVLIHLVLDGSTVYTVNHLDTVPELFNDILHRLFLGSMVVVIFLFYQYIAILVQEETGKGRRLDWPARIFLIVAVLGNFLLPISYTVTAEGNYSSGPYMYVPYAAVAFYLLLCAGLFIVNWKQLDQKKRSAIGIALAIEFVVCVLQGLNHTWLISGMGITLMTLSFYLTLENPEALRTELIEQKMSMLYLKSQVNPHFLYNTLDTIRIQAQLNGDKQVADLLMRLVDFFRLSVKVDRPMVTLDDEMELLKAYMELMCCRYPELSCEYDIDPDLGGAEVPNFILQPIVENSLLHGLKNKGYRGEVEISAQKTADGCMEISVQDTGSGFAECKKAVIDQMLQSYAKQPPKLTGKGLQVQVLHAYEKNLRPCVGCNACWLVTPGIFAIKDGYEELLKAYLEYDAVLFLAGTALNFVDHRMKNLVDRMLPLATMYIHIADGQCRHVPRYDNNLRFGLLYSGSADKAYLNRWMERVMLNFAGESLGAYPISNAGEVLSCI